MIEQGTNSLELTVQLISKTLVRFSPALVLINVHRSTLKNKPRFKSSEVYSKNDCDKDRPRDLIRM